MEKLGAVLLVTLGTAALVFVVVLLGTVLGAFSGWLVGLLFGETILKFFAALGVTGLEMWQIGASLGFAGGFFRSYSTSGKA